MGSHLVDLARYLLSAEPVTVFAQADPVFPVRTPQGGQPRQCLVSNFFYAALTFPDTAVHVSTTAAAHAEQRFDITAYGHKGDLTFDLRRKLLLHRLGKEPIRLLGADVDAEYDRQPDSSIFTASFGYLAEQIVHTILKGKAAIPAAATVHDGLRCAQILDAALKSTQNGTSQQLDQWTAVPAF